MSSELPELNEEEAMARCGFFFAADPVGLRLFDGPHGKSYEKPREMAKSPFFQVALAHHIFFATWRV